MSPFGVPVLRKFAKSSHVYTCHFGIEALMSHYLDKDFKAEYLEIPASVRSEEYYVKMMIAWFFATALAKQWDLAIPYIGCTTRLSRSPLRATESRPSRRNIC